IIGGSDSGKGQFPFAVHLTIHTTPTQGFYCVGSLITNSYVVTAAHCLTKAESSQKLNPADILVRYGGENVNSMQQARADQITVHDEWNPTNLHNDIALLRLSQPVAFGPNVQPARISRMSMTTPQTQVVALGWGQTTNDMMSASPTLKHVMIQTGDEMSCRRVMPEFTNSDANVVCTANTPGRDTCYGDSGGPLVTMETVRNDRSAEPTRVATLVGLTSFGDTASHSSHPLCGSGEIVAFYTHVAHYADWIAGITGVGRQ
ncbi:trypsin-like serine protease, partial [Ramicandelaber brevisporus]